MIPAAAFGEVSARARRPGVWHPATRLAALLLALVVVLTADWRVVAPTAALLVRGLVVTGLGARAQLRQLRPWLPMAALALLIHTLTTTAAAPLGQPSWAGAAAGLRALLRVGASLAALGLYVRSGTLGDLVTGLGWWLSPLRRVGVRAEDLGLVLAVACGTVPQVIGEGRRLRAVDELRRQGPGGRTRRHAWLARAQLVVPLLETLIRRAETLELALRGRRPAVTAAGGPRRREWALLTAGLAFTVASVLLRKGA